MYRGNLIGATWNSLVGSPSHQLLVSRSFFGTSDWRGLPGKHDVCETLSHAWQNIGLHVDGPDNQIEDSVFFCSGIGIKLTGSANYFEGVLTDRLTTGAAEVRLTPEQVCMLSQARPKRTHLGPYTCLRKEQATTRRTANK